MQNRVIYYEQLADDTVNRICNSPQQLKHYLEQCGRFYKYSFEEQVMIYAQRPTATAVATYDIWTKRMNRYIKRGAKGIRLLNGGYLFDESDTGMKRDSAAVPRWEMLEKDRQNVSAQLRRQYGFDGEKTDLPETVAALSQKLVGEHMAQHEVVYTEKYGMKHGSDRWEAFNDLASQSVGYAFAYRCGIGTGQYHLERALGTFLAHLPEEGWREYKNMFLSGIPEITTPVFKKIERMIWTERDKEKEHEKLGVPQRELRYYVEEIENHGSSQYAIIDRTNDAVVGVGLKQSDAELYADQLNIMDSPEIRLAPGDSICFRINGAAVSGKIMEVGEQRITVSVGFTVWSYEGEDMEALERMLRQDPRNYRLFQGLPEASVEQAKKGIPQTVKSVCEGDKGLSERDIASLDEARRRKIKVGGKNLTEDTSDPLKQADIPRADAPKAESKEIREEKAGNFHITDTNLGTGGAKAKYRANVAAIRLLKELETQGRNAAPGEQEILSRYVGWGGLPNAFDPENASWSQEYEELRSLLTQEEYEAARASTLNSHYTSPTVIRAIYDAVEQIGFKTGKILEPAMGVGNFFGLLPESMQGSQLYGVELDSITGRIAQKLYPEADITVAGFETTDRRDFYDLAVGNVPFGNYRVSDKPYDKLGFSIHNYFFAKALDQVRPGGVVAFVTSHYTMDSKNSDARRYMAQRAELLGAIRLPDNAFYANAGTNVVSDIIFLQKREHPIDQDFDWVYLEQTPEGIPLNSYFVEHPEMVLGNLKTDNTRYGREECTVVPIPGMKLADQLKEAIVHIRGSFEQRERGLEELNRIGAEETPNVLPAYPDVRNFSYTVVDGDVFFRENSEMTKSNLKESDRGRVAALCELRDLARQIILAQLAGEPDGWIRERQKELESAYDIFTEKYGLINSKANAKVFDRDSSYYLLCSLENLDEDGKLRSKADFFYKRTVRPEKQVFSANTASEALAVSIGQKGCVDLPYMADLLGAPGEYGMILNELKGVIFRNPEKATSDPYTGYETADEYLSGNVREKLRTAEQYARNQADLYGVNVEYLKQAQPKDLSANEIQIRLGATWISKNYVQQFMNETFHLPFWYKIQAEFAELTGEWRITEKSRVPKDNVDVYVTYGTKRMGALQILEDTLNLRDSRIYDTVEYQEAGETKAKRVLNRQETMIVQQKQQMIKDAFSGWVFKDPRRRNDLVQLYNEKFNSVRPREFNGSHISFVGMNPEIELRKHQKNAVAHILYGGNTLLAHEVGAGKTFEMVAAAMESKRLGLCQKSLFVVPNHLTLQWANEFLRLYPGANILVANKKDFETANRKKFCARIATGDYDAVIIGHSQFEKIPLSSERQKQELQSQIGEITNAIASVRKMYGQNITIKMMEKTKKSLQVRLEKLMAAGKKDDVVTFEQLGVDRLFVDESHAFKNLYLYTKMRNVAGLSTSEAQKSSDMYMKCRYMDEITGNRGTVFATGTPVSNSMTELYTVMRYLQADTLKQLGLSQFDAWASTFGETQTAVELAPEGTGYRARTRFSKFYNLPELMNIFKQVADIKTADQLNLPLPEANFKTILAQPSEIQKEMVLELSDRAAAVHSGAVDPANDNMLKITSDGRKIGLDQRLINPELPDEPKSKLNMCINNVYKIWEDGKKDRLTQLVFCDLSTPKGDGTWNVYDDIRNKLIKQGIPEKEIAFIHEADSETKKKELFSKVRSGQVRILIGSTQKMGAGTNVQDRLIALHHLDVGWKPSDMTQRNGRIIRQGNMNKEVDVYQYVTEGTFDAYLYQTLENKQKFIGQIMTSKSPVRSCDDIDEEALSYAEIKALCAGNPLIKEKMNLDVETARLKVLRSSFLSQKYSLEDMLLYHYPAEIARTKDLLKRYDEDIKTVKANTQNDEFSGIELNGIFYSDIKEAGKALIKIAESKDTSSEKVIGQYRGFVLTLGYDKLNQELSLNLVGKGKYNTYVGSNAVKNIERLDDLLNEMPKSRLKLEQKLDGLIAQQKVAKEKVKEEFPQEAELKAKVKRLSELDSLLNMDEGMERTETKEEVELEKTEKRQNHRRRFL